MMVYLGQSLLSGQMVQPILVKDTFLQLIARQQQVMRGVLREPIHPRTVNRGKLRKILRTTLRQQSAEQHLLLTPSIILSQKHREPRQKLHHFFRSHPDPQNLSCFSELVSSCDQGGSFRAIHTARPEDSSRGFPLRSITPIKPFRRGIRSKAHDNNTLEIYSLPQQLRSNKNAAEERKEHKKNLSEILVQSPASVLENAEYEEFYKYKQGKDAMSGSKESESRKLAGSRIEPFKKYQIREVHRGAISLTAHHP